jgi:hypothetical protein
MATSLPIINQATKPAGVAGQSRDDLALYTGTNPIQLSDGGVGGVSWLWEIIDKPPGSSASLTTPNLSTCNIIDNDVAGSIEIQLTVNGGGNPGEIYRIIAATQIALPSWVTPSTASLLRIPAFGETTEFNVQSSPGVGANSRGWAQEMDQWFRALSAFAFGVRVEAAGAPVSTDPFYTINFAGAGVTSVTDVGSGKVTVTISGGSGGVGLSNNGSGVVGGPFSVINATAPVVPATESYFSDLNAQWASLGVGLASLRVTNGQHQTTHHASGIFETNLVSKPTLAGTIVTASNPNTWSFDPIVSGCYAVTRGRTVTDAEIGSPIVFSLLPTGDRYLVDLLLDETTLVSTLMCWLPQGRPTHRSS